MLQFLLVAAFLVAAPPILPVFFLGPLALLLLVSHPRTAREWLWIAIAIVALWAWLQLPTSLSQRVVRASAAFFIGAFVSFALAGVRSLCTRALLAVTVAAAATLVWFLAFHLRFADLQHDFMSQTWEASRQMSTTLPSAPPAVTLRTLQDPAADLAHRLAATVAALSALYPALLAVAALLGSWLAWTWYQRIALHPIAGPARSFRDFRFNDHLVWVLVLTIAVVIFPTPHSVQLAGANVLTLTLALYWMRGLAVLRTALLRASPLVIAIVILIMLPMLAFVLVGFTLLGVADTWVDFRRRMAPTTGVPS